MTEVDIGALVFDQPLVRAVLGTAGLIGAILIVIGLIVRPQAAGAGRALLLAGSGLVGAAVLLTLTGTLAR